MSHDEKGGNCYKALHPSLETVTPAVALTNRSKPCGVRQVRLQAFIPGAVQAGGRCPCSWALAADRINPHTPVSSTSGTRLLLKESENLKIPTKHSSSEKNSSPFLTHTGRAACSHGLLHTDRWRFQSVSNSSGIKIRIPGPRVRSLMDCLHLCKQEPRVPAAPARNPGMAHGARLTLSHHVATIIYRTSPMLPRLRCSVPSHVACITTTLLHSAVTHS